MSRPKHGDEPPSVIRSMATSARYAVWNSDAALLVLLGLGALLWPWLGWVAAAAYFAVMSLLALTVWLARRSSG